ncbi:FxsA family protein [Campylobacter sp. MOP7]|uniref:FxsA family protein n=1 Tax=Campylobacter canis TaxID=3378588 RepID=UPI00387EB639
MLRFLFMPYVAIEAICAYFFISEYGFLTLVLEVISTAVLGMFFMFRVGFFQLFSRILLLKPSDLFGVLGMPIGGFFLFLPGVATDTLGVILVIFALFSNFKNPSLKSEQSREFRSYNNERSGEEGEIIDVEVVEEERKYK